MGGPPVRYGPGVQVSAAERRAAMAELRVHVRKGRVAGDDIGARFEAVVAARVRADLAAVLADLPEPSGRPRRHPMPRRVGWHRFWPRR
ncbi:MAG TPA: DUF1707 domain-containing protein [Acidimicrobiales bacterium]|nr:DUF1707 domain-containing protein [Acidimicrobiales bacterium]